MITEGCLQFLLTRFRDHVMPAAAGRGLWTPDGLPQDVVGNVRERAGPAPADGGQYVVRRYRVPATQLVPALIAAALFLLVGLGALSEPWRQVGVGGVVIAVLGGGAGVYAAAVALTNQVTLTPAGISYRSNLRSAAIPWALVESFRVGPSARWGGWSCVLVDVSQRGSVRLPVAGARRYVRRTMAEFDAYRAGLGGAPGTGHPDHAGLGRR